MQNDLSKMAAFKSPVLIDDSKNRIDLIKQGQADIVILYPHQVPLELDSKLVKADEYLLLGHPSWKGRELIDILTKESLLHFIQRIKRA